MAILLMYTAKGSVSVALPTELTALATWHSSCSHSAWRSAANVCETDDVGTYSHVLLPPPWCAAGRQAPRAVMWSGFVLWCAIGTTREVKWWQCNRALCSREAKEAFRGRMSDFHVKPAPPRSYQQ